ncbi:MAG: peptidyl-prolyl cis-trans isomerase D, partial [Gammaproteobacteria bacterium]
MLQAIRDKSSGWIGYAIIILISVPFALWGVNSYLGGGGAPPAATVNGEEIGVRDLDRAFANYRQRLSQMFGGNIPESFGSESILKEQVLSQMIEETSLSQYAKDNRYRIGDQELSTIIGGIEVFQRDGKFDHGTYEAQLRSQGFTPAGFELELRRTQAMEQLQAGIAATSFVVPTAEKQFTSLSNQSRKIRSLTRKVSLDGIDVDVAEIEQYYEQQPLRYSIPEKVKIDYIELSLSGIMDGVEIDESVLIDKYNQTKDSYTEAESRLTRHILIRLANDASEEDELAAFEKITAIHQRAIQGEDFAALAKELSEDPGSATDGGSLGDVERGMMVEAFENTLFDMQENDISAPVKTSFGWHVLKLDKV